MKKFELSPHLFTIEDFLSEAECQSLILLSEKLGYEEAKVNAGFSEQVVIKSVRNNERAFYKQEDFARILWKKLAPFVPAVQEGMQAIGLNELFRFYKYHPGQRFKRHRDGAYRRNTEEYSKWTFMIYLNDNFKGGMTSAEKLSVTPKTGKAICFRHELIHEGETVIEGIKYVLRTDIMYRL